MRLSVPTTARAAGLTAVLLAAGAARGEPPPPGGIADFAGPRALALSASIGSAGGNDALYVNPGALGARRRYEAELGGYVERRGNESPTNLYGGSVVDSLTTAVAAGFSYRRSVKGDYTGNLYHLALAAPIAKGLFLGVSGKWISLDGPTPPGGTPQDVSAATGDAGFLYQVTRAVSIGGVGYNLVSIDNADVAPVGAGAGIAVDPSRRLHVAADWRIDFDRGDEPTNRYAAGIEVLLGDFLPLRGGYTHDETLDTKWWSAGAGFVTKDVAFDISYRQSLDDRAARIISGALRLYVFD